MCRHRFPVDVEATLPAEKWRAQQAFSNAFIWSHTACSIQYLCLPFCTLHSNLRTYSFLSRINPTYVAPSGNFIFTPFQYTLKLNLYMGRSPSDKGNLNIFPYFEFLTYGTPPTHHVRMHLSMAFHSISKMVWNSLCQRPYEFRETANPDIWVPRPTKTKSILYRIW